MSFLSQNVPTKDRTISLIMEDGSPFYGSGTIVGYDTSGDETIPVGEIPFVKGKLVGPFKYYKPEFQDIVKSQNRITFAIPNGPVEFSNRYVTMNDVRSEGETAAVWTVKYKPSEDVGPMLPPPPDKDALWSYLSIGTIVVVIGIIYWVKHS